MSDNEIPIATSNEHISVDITAQLTLIACVKDRKTRKPRTTKETKNKQFKLNLAKSNGFASYILLLQTILDKHDRAEYRVTAKKPYSFKYLLKHTP